jgi:hypothetical protein
MGNSYTAQISALRSKADGPDGHRVRELMADALHLIRALRAAAERDGAEEPLRQPACFAQGAARKRKRDDDTQVSGQ